MNIKKITLVLMLLFFVVNLSACGQEDEESDPIIFSEVGVAMALHGYAITAQIETMSFYFRYDDYELNSYFIHTTKELMASIENYITLPRHPLRIRLTDGNIANYAIEPLYLAIYSHSDKNTLGWVVNFMFSGRIPVWLSAGIEAVAKSDIGLYTPDYHSVSMYNFGDLLFAPSYWGTEINNNAINTSYHFVRHLIKANELERLIEKYLSPQYGWDEANILVRQLFYSYFGSDLVTSTVLNYVNVRPNSVHTTYSLTVSSELNVYNFVFSCFSQYRKNIMRYVEALDTETLFAINWYSEFIDFKFSPINVNVFAYVTANPRVGGWADPRGNLIHIYQFWYGAGGIGVIAHEVSHSINGQIGKLPIAPLDEGLADTLRIKFFASDYVETYMFILTMDYLKDDPSRLELATDIRLRELNMHFRAYYRLNHTDYVRGGGPFGGGFNGEIGFVSRYKNPDSEGHIAAINTYSTALSFVYYLIMTYGAENYMQVHWDIDNFESVYNRTICEAIEEWRSFLIELAIEEWDVFNELRDMAKEMYANGGNVTWSENWGQ